MEDQRALRQRRLANEYRELMTISGSVIEIEPLGGAPYEKYRVTFHVRTIVSPAPDFRDQTVCILTIPAGYPDIVPKIAMEEGSMPQPWHPNWYKSGTWCFGFWAKEESLVSYLYRCAKTIQFSPAFTDARPDAAANREAVAFWNANLGRDGVIPSDTKELPTADAEAPRISILARSNPKIRILRD